MTKLLINYSTIYYEEQWGSYQLNFKNNNTRDDDVERTGLREPTNRPPSYLEKGPSCACRTYLSFQMQAFIYTTSLFVEAIVASAAAAALLPRRNVIVSVPLASANFCSVCSSARMAENSMRLCSKP